MNILILSNSDGGLYLFRRELIEHISSKHNVICSVPDSDGYTDKLRSLGCQCKTIEINRRGTNPIQELGLLKYYLRLIAESKPDVVLTYTIKPNVYGGIACRIKKIPYIANITGLGTTIEDGGVLSKISLLLYKIGLKDAKCVFFQNAQNKAFFEKERIVKHNTKLIPGSGVNVETHKLEEYPEDGELFRFLFVGRVMKNKGIEELLQSVDELNRDFKNVFLDVVGGCDENYSPMLNEFEKKGIVKYHGSQTDVHKYYKNAHCVVLPSYHEGMANVMLEAASTGRPVIASRIPGCIETFEENITGFGCEPRNVQSLTEALKKMCLSSWAERRRMGLAGHDKVKREFDRQIIVDAYEKEIDTIQNTS